LESDIVNKATFRSSKVFNIRKIKAGNQYKLYYTKDSSQTLKYFVYSHSPTEYLKISLTSEPKAIRGEKEITTVRKTSSGTISSSLWATMIESNIDPMMAIRLSEIYAWTVDFFGLEEGDQFKVVYDEQFVDSVPIGIGEIYAASFHHRGEELFAYSFEQDGEKSFFDENGKSLRRQFLKAPLRFSRISSGYSNSRFHPILKIRRPHRGVDYAAPTGTPIYSIGDGTVYRKGYTKGAGYYIKIRHNSVYTTGYNHLSRYPRGIKVGQRVKQGDIIGYVGSTGYSTGPHLDFRMWKNGNAVDPLKIKAPPVKPITEKDLPYYQNAISALKKELGKIES
jgi:murein DD-endopeptidase MepM/ murein hydrolase activator NlpD